MIKIGDKIQFSYEIDVPYLSIFAMEKHTETVIGVTKINNKKHLIVKTHFGTDCITINEAIKISDKPKQFKKERIKELNTYSYKCLVQRDFYPYGGGSKSVHNCINWYKKKGYKLAQMFNRNLILQ